MGYIVTNNIYKILDDALTLFPMYRDGNGMTEWRRLSHLHARGWGEVGCVCR